MEDNSPQHFQVLFVDNDPNILKAIRRDLHRSSFALLMANTSVEALRILEETPVDLLITEVRMPESDGLKLLKIAKARYPGMFRIILSGYVEHSYVVSAILKGYATSYLTKPWERSTLIQAMENIRGINLALKNCALQALLNSIERLPSLPMLYQRFIQAVADERSIHEIAQIISKDVALSSRAIQLANSAIYGVPNLATAEQAIVRLGLKAMKDMVLVLSFINDQNWPTSQMEQLKDIAFHSYLVNRFLKRVHELRHRVPFSQDLSSVGLLHDIGKLVILRFFPGRYDSVLAYMAEHPGLGFYESEIALGYEGTTHGEIGAYLLQLWNLPLFIVDVAMHHHKHQSGAGQSHQLLESAFLADRLIEFMTSRNLSASNAYSLPAPLKSYFSPEEWQILVHEVKEELLSPALVF